MNLLATIAAVKKKSCINKYMNYVLMRTFHAAKAPVLLSHLQSTICDVRFKHTVN
jgi:hypothetical protein